MRKGKTTSAETPPSESLIELNARRMAKNERLADPNI